MSEQSYREADRCHHCGSLPDADGDHSCPCPLSNSECLEHTLNPVATADSASVAGMIARQWGVCSTCGAARKPDGDGDFVCGDYPAHTTPPTTDWAADGRDGGAS